MKLQKILDGIEFEIIKGDLNIEIKDINYDSRNIKKDNLFIAVSGFKQDGHDFIDSAVINGASAVIIEKELDFYHPGVSYIKVENSRREMAAAANNFFNKPLRYIDLIGITGTNGKTTTAFLIYSILKEAGIKTALFGTIKNVIDNEEISAKRTTPESLDLYRYFSEMVKKDVRYAVMEVSSHALDLYRVEQMEFTLAVFTNLSSEHLDYHKTMENYKKAKSKLFSQLKNNGFAVINYDDQYSSFMFLKSSGENYSYSLKNENADLYVDNYSLKKHGLSYKTAGLFEENFDLKLGGLFNVYNSLAAVLSSFLLGVKKNTAAEALRNIDGVPGRFELINEGQDYQVIVDYAHTPDGMKNVLEAVENIKTKRLIVLFGCGGDRDRGKRPLMAELAEEYADFVIVTNDNPRSEEAEKILEEIKSGFSSEFKKYKIIPDRRQAIYHAISMAEKNDIVLLLGRGHEKYQIIKDQKIELDDRDVAREFIKTAGVVNGEY
jgi:UDP-N-acetylmuramoyl-L-alanyl-D-glutamate--2,6-diaminopimelate ligase